ncbi:MAG: hypothetical protein PWR10_1991 [Halanaerobiales bacterium]|nr:hypothetical protein [Halanaerobiales bacterium]
MNDQGISVKPTPITAGERVEVSYNGLLAQSGAMEVYLHAGFGMNNLWENVQDIKMERQGNTWKASLDIETDERFNFCFHDNVGNWDNNNGRNWSFEVHNGDLY